MSAEPNKIIFSMIGVNRTHGKRQVIKDISLSFFYGAKIGVLGLNGAGKSTLLQILSGALHPTSGRVLIGGVDGAENPDKVRREIGFRVMSGPLEIARISREHAEMGLIPFLQFLMYQ